MSFTVTQQPIDLSSMNPSQTDAVCSVRGPVLVLAGAGSGKTRVLTHKIAHLIGQGVEPGRILAVTFTNKAAKEMSARVESLLGGGYHSGMWIGTFHSICGRLLRREINKYKSDTGRTWNNNFVIYDESDSVAAVKESIKSLGLDDKLYTPKNIKYMISNLKNQLIGPHEYGSSAKDFKGEKLARIYDGYEAILSRNNAMDFDDLLQKAVEVLQQDASVLQRYHQQFQHVLVDEFQDTNDAQYELVRLIVEGCRKSERSAAQLQQLWQDHSFTVVGDVDQSIYSWRGANFKIILNFQKDYPDAKLIKLEHNYRSTEHILKAANAIIENNAERLEKTLIAVKGQGEKITCYEAKDDRDEAYYVINKFQQLIDTGKYKPGDCAILYRTNSQSRVFEDVMMSKGISYTIVGGLKFYERREIKDVMAYLTVVFNDQDAYSVKRILNVPKRGIGKTSIEKMEAYANQSGLSLYEALKQIDRMPEATPKLTKAVGGFVTIIENLKQQVAQADLGDFIIAVVEQTGYLDELKVEDPMDNEGRIQNVEELVSVARQYMMDNPEEGDLVGFLTQMSLLSDLDNAEPAENKLVLMTMHAAKGLEFPVVAISGLEESLFPHARSLSDKSQMEEERRLMYVGVTRAEENLTLTYARRRMVFGDLRYSTPSRFLKELPQDAIQGAYSLDQESRSSDEGGYGRGRQNRYGSEPTRVSGYSSSRFEEDEPPISRIRSKAERLSVPKPPAVKLLAVGSRVSHAKFGPGTIDQVIGEGEKAVYSVKFDAIPGKKLLDPKFAKLEPI